uniref:Uncharacterized protein n=1 Tax=Trichogramma kaykai TaxID=54128 RepID=A0ABD2X3W8_9HYME
MADVIREVGMMNKILILLKTRNENVICLFRESVSSIFLNFSLLHVYFVHGGFSSGIRIAENLYERVCLNTYKEIKSIETNSKIRRCRINSKSNELKLLSDKNICRQILKYEHMRSVHLPQNLGRNSGYILRAREGLGAIRLSSYSVCGAHVTLYRDFILFRLVVNCAASPMRSVIYNRD